MTRQGRMLQTPSGNCLWFINTQSVSYTHLVNGIPHAFAVKNGKLIWRGHPGKLSEEMMRAMLKPDFSAASLPGDNPGANARAWKLYRQVSERTGELARKGGKGEAQAFLRQIQDSGQFQPVSYTHLFQFPVPDNALSSES